MRQTKLLLKSLIFIFPLFFMVSSFALPPGSYLKSCQACVLQADTLTCSCLTKRRSRKTSSLTQASNCTDIRNDDGQLTCFSRLWKDFPPGGYQDSCKECYIKGHALYCRCITMRGIWINSAIYYFHQCKTPIENVNGNLICKFKSWPLPPGDYRRNCFNCRYNGFDLACQCIRADGTQRYSVLKGAHVCINIRNVNGWLRCW